MDQQGWFIPTDPQFWVLPDEPPDDFIDNGCSHVKDIYKPCCREHDWNYERIRRGDWTMTRSEADRRFRRCMQGRSLVGRFSPISWIRWFGVRLGGWTSVR